MGYGAAYKILREHLLEGELVPGKEITLKIDQTLTQDSTGTMAYLQLEAMGIEKVKTKKSVAYVDHNLFQEDFKNPDDHRYLQTVAAKHGVYFSRPGNGVCHQVHLERFAVPGETLLGSDSHTPTAGGIGALAIGAGGLDVAVAMGGGGYSLTMPQIYNVILRGKLQPWVSAKDIILELLRRLTVKGGVGKIFEYSGEGVETLTVPQRATITNMGAELGATTSIFPSDEMTRGFLRAQGREGDFRPIAADPDAFYDGIIEIDLDALTPRIAKPHSPDNVVAVKEVEGLKVDQVCIGSCTNASYQDLMRVARILKGKTVASHVSLTISPGSKQVLTMLAANGALADLIDAGARILEAGCGPCIGMGQAPPTGGVSLRTFNRNFKGRCGTQESQVYLVSPETAAVSAINGEITDPRQWGEELIIPEPKEYPANDNGIIPPYGDEVPFADRQVIRGPNIKPFPLNKELSDKVEGKVLIKLGDNITTDHIMPSNAALLPYRSNIPYLSDFCLHPCDPGFACRAKEEGGGFVVGGSNYGQGSSREHAALVPLYLGVKGVLAKSFARIHRANLINSGILPLEFNNEMDYEHIEPGDLLVIEGVREQLSESGQVILYNKTKEKRVELRVHLTPRERNILLNGGLINTIRKEHLEKEGKKEGI
jgi:aconitate hydratase